MDNDRVSEAGSTMKEEGTNDLANIEARLAGHLAVEADATVPLYVADLLEAVPALRRLGPEELLAFQADVRRQAEILVRAVGEGRSYQPSEQVELAEIGGRLWRWGIPAQAIHRGALVAQSRGLAQVQELVEAGQDPASLFPLVKVFFGRTVELAGLVAAGHEQAAMCGRTVREALADLGTDLVDGRFESPDELVGRARRLGLDLAGPLGLVVFASTRPGKRIRELDRAGAALAKTLPGALLGRVRMEPVPHGVVVVPADADVWDERVSQAEEVALERCIVALAVRPVASVEQVHPAYEQAAGGIGVAVRAAPRAGVVPSGHLVVPQLLSTAPAEVIAELADGPAGRLFKLPPPQRARSVAAAEALCETGGDDAQAAALVGIKPSSVRSRMQRLKAKTGLSFDDPEATFQLRLALLALRVFPDRDWSEHPI